MNLTSTQVNQAANGPPGGGATGERLSVCYVLVSDGQDEYARQALIAAMMLRRLHADARIALLCDTTSKAALQHERAQVLDLLDQVVEISTPHHHPVLKNRWIKTQSRLFLKGDYVYLDMDALPVRPLQGILQQPGELAAVLEREYENTRPHTPLWTKPIYDANGWPFPPARYFNGGVLLVRDTPGMHAFFQEWHRRWNLSIQSGRPLDQPSLNSTIDAVAPALSVLPDRFNALVEADSRLAQSACVYHFFASLRRKSPNVVSLLDHLLEHHRHTGQIDWSMIDYCRQTDYPWVGYHSLRRLVARRMYGRAAINFADRLCRYATGRPIPDPGRPRRKL